MSAFIGNKYVVEQGRSRGPIALRYAKEAVRQGMEMPLDQALRLELREVRTA